MSASADESADDMLVQILADYDEALAARKCPPCDSDAGNVDNASATFLAREMACLRLLRQIWPATASTATVEAPFPVPHTFGRFRIRRQLGFGGFGLVFLAFDPHSDCEVALKIPRPRGIASPEMKGRFVREAHALAGLNHPNIVGVHEWGEVEGIGYLATEYIDGPNLAAWMQSQERPIPVETATSLVAELADAVEHAHGRGVLHRDIKPANVLLSPSRDGEGMQPASCSLGAPRPKLTDFGLARFREQARSETKSGALLGTLRYMAPEQAAGQNRRVGPWTDIYALGVILYELLASRPPHAEETDHETIMAIVHCDAEPVSHWRPEVPCAVDTICQRCLAKSPEARYSSAGALANDLRHLLSGQPIQARPVNFVERSLAWTRRRPASAALILLGVLVAAGVAVGAAAHTARMREARDDAALRRREAIDRERTIRHHAYAADMQLALLACRNGAPSQAREILNRYAGAEEAEDLRGFEWHYVSRLSQSERLTLRAHRGDVYCAVFSPDGRTVVSAGKDHLVHIWDADTGALRKTLRGHDVEIGSVSFAPDGSEFLTTSSDGTLRCWQLLSGRQIASCRPESFVVGSAVLCRDGKSVIAGDRNGQIRIFDRSMWRSAGASHEVHPPAGLKSQMFSQRILARSLSRVSALALSHDGKSLAVFNDDGTGRCWDLKSGSVRFAFPRRNQSINGCDFSPADHRIATAGGDGTVELWDSLSGEQIASLRGHADQVETVAFAPGGRLLASGGRDASIRLWPLPSGRPSELRGHNSIVWSVAFSPDGKTLASASRDGTVKLWDPEHGSGCTRLVLPDSSSVLTVAWAPDSQTAALGRRDGRIEVLRGANLETTASIDIPGSYANQIEYSPDGGILAAACSDGAIRLFQADSALTQKRLLKGHGRAALCMAFAPDGRTLVSGGDDGRLIEWDLLAGRPLRALAAHDLAVTAVAYCPWKKSFASASRDQSIRFWDLRTGTRQALLQNGGPVQSFAFLSDARTLAVAEGNHLSLWQATETDGGWTGPLVQPLSACRVSPSPRGQQPILALIGTDTYLRAARVNPMSRLKEIGVNGRSHLTSCATIAPDGKSILTGALNGSVIRWDTADWRPRASRLSFGIGGGPVRFSGDGRTLAIGGLAGHVHLCHPSDGSEIAAIGPFTDAPVSKIALSHAGDTLVLSRHGLSRLWIEGKGGLAPPPWGDPLDVKDVELSSDDRLAVVGSCGGPLTRITLWDLKTGREIGQLPDQAGCDHQCLALAPGGQLLITAVGDQPAIWDVPTRRRLAVLPTHRRYVARIAFSPDGKRCATAGSSDGTVRQFSLDRLGGMPLVIAHPAAITALAYSADGRTLALGDENGKVRLLSAETGQETIVLDAHAGGVADLAFAPQENVLVTSGTSKEGAGEATLWRGTGIEHLPAGKQVSAEIPPDKR